VAVMYRVESAAEDADGGRCHCSTAPVTSDE
jgi:hypothetical protein